MRLLYPSVGPERALICLLSGCGETAVIVTIDITIILRSRLLGNRILMSQNCHRCLDLCRRRYRIDVGTVRRAVYSLKDPA
jgi:hypothetical protein